MQEGGAPATLCGVTVPDDETVPRDAVWRYVRRYNLPRQETMRMAGGMEGAIGLLRADKRARIIRTAAIRLLGEAEVDARWPMLGEHRAAVAGVPAARVHYGAFPWCTSPARWGADNAHARMVQHLGGALLLQCLVSE